MPKSETPTEVSKFTAQLLDRMHRANTAKELREICAGAKEELITHGKAEVDMVVADYKAMLGDLQGRVKLTDLNGEFLTVNKARYTSSKFSSEGYIIEGVRENGDTFSFYTSAMGFLREFAKDEVQKNLPLRYMFKLDTHPTDPTKTMWSVSRLAPENRDQAEIPF